MYAHAGMGDVILEMRNWRIVHDSPQCVRMGPFRPFHLPCSLKHSHRLYNW